MSNSPFGRSPRDPEWQVREAARIFLEAFDKPAPPTPAVHRLTYDGVNQAIRSRCGNAKTGDTLASEPYPVTCIACMDA